MHILGIYWGDIHVRKVPLLDRCLHCHSGKIVNLNLAWKFSRNFSILGKQFGSRCGWCCSM